MTEARSNHDTALGEGEGGGGGVGAAEARVARAGVAFSASLRDASRAGRETVERVAWAARPLLIGAGVLAGAIVVTRWWRGPRQIRERRLPAALPIRQEWPELARSLAFALATVAVRRLARRWLARQPRSSW